MFNYVLSSKLTYSEYNENNDVKSHSLTFSSQKDWKREGWLLSGFWNYSQGFEEKNFLS